MSASVSAYSTASTKIAWSDPGYKYGEGEEAGPKMLGIYGKPGVKIGNLVMIPLLLFMTMFADTDILQSIIYLLQDDKFYAKSQYKAKNIITASTSYATFVSLAALLSSGFMFDMLGR